MGIKKNDNVAFLVERSELYMFSILSILSAGAVYVPLDDTLPDERIKFMINDTDAQVVIVCDETYKRAKKLSNEIKLLNISNIIKEPIGTSPKLNVDYGYLACILYTSGTTGIPKGVKIIRKSLLNVTESYIEDYGLDNNDVYGLSSAIGFDTSNFVISAVMHAGASLSVIPEDIKFNIHKLNEYFIKQNVTHTFISTQVAKLFMEQIDNTPIQTLLVGGEKLGEFKNPHDYLLIDGYGPTESCAFVSSIDNNNKIDKSSVGNLNHNTKAYILDNEYRRVPFGAVGELYLSGYQISDGYLNRPEENTKAFFDNPFDDDKGYERIYRTGDIVRFLPDGTLGIVGRRDSQVKIRGNRVELTEIEAVIREIDYVEDVTVQTVKHDTNNEVVAYVVVNTELDEDMLKDSISTYVGEHKPEYMIPSYVVKLESIPLNVNGKVDKRALPEIDFDSLHAEYVAPTNPLEGILVEAFEKVFNQRIGIYDDFVRLGGDSLTAIRLLSNIGDYGITVADILSLRTPHAIANSIKDISLDLDIYSIDEGCPLNNTQMYMYKDILLKNKKDAYKIPYLNAIPKKYTLKEICDALDKIFEVHPILRMCVSPDHEIPYLVKGDKPPVTILSPEDGFDEILNFLKLPFDLYSNLSRYLIFEDNDNYYLAAIFHHMIFDALSKNTFEKNLMHILDGGIIDEVDDSFLRISAFHQQMQHSEEFSQITQYAESIMGNLDNVGFLLDNGKSNTPGLLEINLEVDNDLLESFIKKAGINKSILFTGAFAYTLSQVIGKDEVFFGIIENGRDRFKNFDNVGLFINPLPMVVNCKHPNTSSFMQYMSKNVYDMMNYNFYPFSLVALELGIEPIILFQYMPNWITGENGELDEIQTPNESFENAIISQMEDSMVESLIQVIQSGENYSLSILYSDYYSKELMERFGECYKLTLSQIINGTL